METRFSLTIKQAMAILLGVALCAAIFTLVVFYLGQQSALRLPKGDQAELTAQAGRGAETAIAVPPTLPQAMTATARPKTTEVYIFTDSSATQLLQEQVSQVGSETGYSIKSVSFTPEQIKLSGEIDTMGFHGSLEITGKPVVVEKRLRFQILEVTVSGQNLPKPLLPTIEAEINKFFDQTLVGYDVEGVKLEAGQMTVTLSPW